MDIGGHLVFIESFKRIQWWTICVLMCIAILMAWIAVRWGHMPIRRANEKIRAITSSKLHMRLDPKEVPVELEATVTSRSEEHTSELQSRGHLVCRLLLEKNKK